MPRVTVWLTSYNHANFLKESIDSVLQQTYADFELYIVDDGSSDNSWSLIQSYTDPRIRSIRHETNQGRSGMDAMLGQLKGEYVAIAHCDDKWMLDKLEKQVAFLDAHLDVSACFTQVQVIDENSQPVTDEKHIYYNIFNQPNRSRHEWIRYFFEHGNCLCHPSVLIRRKAYTQYGLFTHGLSGIPDFIQWIRLCRHAEIWIYPEQLSYFRIRKNEQNTSGDAADKHYRNFTEQFLTMGEYVDMQDSQEILQVFPESKRYLVDGEIIPEYAYARILLEQPDSPAKHLYAHQLLYGLMQKPESRKKLEILYGYTQKEFAKEKQKEDIFSLISPTSFLNTVLYIDRSDGFNEQNSIHQPVYITHSEQFSASFQVPQEGGRVKALRFDPDCNFWRVYREIRVWVNGEPVEAVPLGAQRKDGQDFFFTLDPQYLLQIEPGIGPHTVQIEGKCSLLPSHEVEKEMVRLKYEGQEQGKRLEELGEKEKAHQIELERLSKEKDAAYLHAQKLEEELRKLVHTIRKHPIKTGMRVLLKKI